MTLILFSVQDSFSDTVVDCVCPASGIVSTFEVHSSVLSVTSPVFCCAIAECKLNQNEWIPWALNLQYKRVKSSAYNSDCFLNDISTTDFFKFIQFEHTTIDSYSSVQFHLKYSMGRFHLVSNGLSFDIMKSLFNIIYCENWQLSLAEASVFVSLLKELYCDGIDVIEKSLNSTSLKFNRLGRYLESSLISVVCENNTLCSAKSDGLRLLARIFVNSENTSRVKCNLTDYQFNILNSTKITRSLSNSLSFSTFSVQIIIDLILQGFELALPRFVLGIQCDDPSLMFSQIELAIEPVEIFSTIVADERKCYSRGPLKIYIETDDCGQLNYQNSCTTSYERRQIHRYICLVLESFWFKTDLLPAVSSEKANCAKMNCIEKYHRMMRDSSFVNSLTIGRNKSRASSSRKSKVSCTGRWKWTKKVNSRKKLNRESYISNFTSRDNSRKTDINKKQNSSLSCTQRTQRDDNLSAPSMTIVPSPLKGNHSLEYSDNSFAGVHRFLQSTINTSVNTNSLENSVTSSVFASPLSKCGNLSNVLNFKKLTIKTKQLRKSLRFTRDLGETIELLPEFNATTKDNGVKNTLRKCPGCSLMFVSPRPMVIHIQHQHLNGVTKPSGSPCVDPKCPIPIRVFNEIAHLLKHVLQFENNCKYCSFSCKTKGGLSRHLSMHEVC